MKYLITWSLSWVVLAAASPASGSIAGYMFPDLVNRSELIVEGTVVEQKHIPDDSSPRWRSEEHNKATVFRISHIHKGQGRPGDRITILTHFGFVCDTCRPLLGKSYLLMLKPLNENWVDTNHGQGMFELIKLGSETYAVDADFAGGAPTLAGLRQDIAWVLAGPTSRPAEVTISADQALKAAKAVFRKAGENLEGCKLTKHYLSRIASDSVNFAWKDDPIWILRWEAVPTEPKAVTKAGPFVGCYVHAITGEVGLKKPGDHLPVEDRCRIFLKSCRLYRDSFGNVAEKSRLGEVAEEEFRAAVPKLRDKYLTLRGEYEDGTKFYFMDFPETSVRERIVFVVGDNRRIHFVGVLPAVAGVGTSQSAPQSPRAGRNPPPESEEDVGRQAHHVGQDGVPEP